MAAAVVYDPRYLAGVLFFNARDFFEAHEVWEDLWHVTALPERRFYQGLIQAAVSLFHFGNGNFGGATRLYRSSLEYMKPSFPYFQGLDLERFWKQMAECYADVLEVPQPPRDARPDPAKIPTIELDPPPETWPDPESLLPPEKDK
jgi:predicted metal-dependent hydrolase